VDVLGQGHVGALVGVEEVADGMVCPLVVGEQVGGGEDGEVVVLAVEEELVVDVVVVRVEGVGDEFLRGSTMMIRDERVKRSRKYLV